MCGHTWQAITGGMTHHWRPGSVRRESRPTADSGAMSRRRRSPSESSWTRPLCGPSPGRARRPWCPWRPAREWTARYQRRDGGPAPPRTSAGLHSEGPRLGPCRARQRRGRDAVRHSPPRKPITHSWQPSPARNCHSPGPDPRSSGPTHSRPQSGPRLIGSPPAPAPDSGPGEWLPAPQPRASSPPPGHLRLGPSGRSPSHLPGCSLPQLPHDVPPSSRQPARTGFVRFPPRAPLTLVTQKLLLPVPPAQA